MARAIGAEALAYMRNRDFDATVAERIRQERKRRDADQNIIRRRFPKPGFPTGRGGIVNRRPSATLRARCPRCQWAGDFDDEAHFRAVFPHGDCLGCQQLDAVTVQMILEDRYPRFDL